jgi:hypothetical protein
MNYLETVWTRDEVATLPYFPELLRAQKALEVHVPYFPKFRCPESTRVGTRRIPELEELAGIFCAGPYADCHAWNYDPERNLIVDLSHRQYLPIVPGITVLPCHPSFSVRAVHTAEQRQMDLPLAEKVLKILAQGDDKKEARTFRQLSLSMINA